MKQKLAILMCTYNGGKFLAEQLASFASQNCQDWQLFVHDDGSSDNTKTLVEKFGQKHQEHSVYFTVNDSKKGFAKNFLHGIAAIPNDFEFFALSDQDDIWLPGKLDKAISYLKDIAPHLPALYCSRSILVDSDANEIGYSPLFTKKPSFANALVQSIAGGNTMVFNKAARDLVIQVKTKTNIVSHDWLIYQLVSGAGNNVYYDAKPEILYRQHSNNLIGSNNGLFARLSRLRMLLNNSFRHWNDSNIKILTEYSHLLTTDNQNKLKIFTQSREASLFQRLFGFLKCGIYRQTLLGNIGLFIGGILNKI